MGTWKLLDANHAVALAVKLARVEVVAMYPITPQTEVIHSISQMTESGEMKAKGVRVESEHSAMMVLLGASTVGSRTFSTSCSQGIALMTEPIWQAPGNRLPIILGVANRPIGYPGASPHRDLNDELLNRDAGWIQFFTESAQEALDTILQAYRICEDERVLLPAMVGWEGRVVSHTAIPVEVPDQEEVDAFLPPYDPSYKLEPEEFSYTTTSGPRYDVWTEYVYLMERAMENAKELITKVNDEFGSRFGRTYGNGLIERYRCEDAEAVLIAMGAIAGTSRVVIDEMRENGHPIGLVKLRTFRPFPTEDLRELAKGVKAIGFIDRCRNPGSPGGGIGSIETAKALYSLEERPLLLSYYAGLVGRDVRPKEIENIAKKVLQAAETGRVEHEVEWVQLREELR